MDDYYIYKYHLYKHRCTTATTEITFNPNHNWHFESQPIVPVWFPEPTSLAPYKLRSHWLTRPCLDGSVEELPSVNNPSLFTFCFFRGEEEPAEAAASEARCCSCLLSSSVSDALRELPSCCCSSMIFCKYFPCASILICNCLWT